MNTSCPRNILRFLLSRESFSRRNKKHVYTELDIAESLMQPHSTMALTSSSVSSLHNNRPTISWPARSHAKTSSAPSLVPSLLHKLQTLLLCLHLSTQSPLILPAILLNLIINSSSVERYSDCFWRSCHNISSFEQDSFIFTTQPVRPSDLSASS